MDSKEGRSEMIKILGKQLTRATADKVATTAGWSLAGIGMHHTFETFDINNPQFWVWFVGAILAGVLGHITGK